jgi:deoxycytidine triphosphate deaminase
VRGGAGIFFDWFEAEDELRASQLDGNHQQVETVLSPGYPIPVGPSAVRLANGRIQLAPSLDQPTIREASLGVEQALGAVRLNVMGIHRRGSRELRGIDLNAPADGVRPDPATGTITDVRSLKTPYPLAPGETIHGITRERITLPGDIGGWLEGRSRFARLGLMIHVTSGFVQPGVASRQVLEMSNVSGRTLLIHAGVRLPQIVLQRCEGSAVYAGRFARQNKL